jgi:tetratricopeptide (TPR) repeat protein
MSAMAGKTLKSCRMKQVLHGFGCAVAGLWLAFAAAPAVAQMGGQIPGGLGSRGGGVQGSDPTGAVQPTPSDKPDAAAKKAFTAGVKSYNKAKEFAAAGNLEKANDNYSRALDQFTEALSNKGDMYEAWKYVGFVHLHLGAYAESVDDFNHAVAINADADMETVEGRAEAYLGVDRLEDAKSAYMDLFNHQRERADQLMAAMQKWLADHRANANGMRPAAVDSFDKWLQERDDIAKQTASLPR